MRLRTFDCIGINVHFTWSSLTICCCEPKIGPTVVVSLEVIKIKSLCVC